MTVWRLNINKNSAGKANYLIKKKVISVGWSFEDDYHAKHNKELDKVISPEDFINKVKSDKACLKEFGNGWWNKKRKWSAQSFQPFVNGSIHEGDYVWLFNPEDDNYYLGRINDPTIHLVQTDETIRYDVGTQIKVTDFHKVGTADTMPGYLTTTHTYRVLRPINSDYAQEFSEHIWNNNISDFKLSLDSFLGYIGYSGVEDLIYAYLHSKYKYEIIPSTNKKSTPTFEFIMKDKDNEKITLQAKNGAHKDLKVSDYKQYLNAYKIIYLFTRNGKLIPEKDTKVVNDTNDCTGLHKLTKDAKGKYILEKIATNKELSKFACDPENKWLLPDIITTWSKYISNL